MDRDNHLALSPCKTYTSASCCSASCHARSLPHWFDFPLSTSTFRIDVSEDWEGLCPGRHISVEKAIEHSCFTQTEDAIYIGIPSREVMKKFQNSGLGSIDGLHCVLRMVRGPQEEKHARLCLESIAVFKNNGIGPLFAYPSESETGTLFRAISSDPNPILFDFRQCNSRHWAAWCASARLRLKYTSINVPLGTLVGRYSERQEVSLPLFENWKPRQSILMFFFSPETLNLRPRRQSALLKKLEQRRLAQAQSQTSVLPPAPAFAGLDRSSTESPTNLDSDSDQGSMAPRQIRRGVSIDSIYGGGVVLDTFRGLRHTWFRSFWRGSNNDRNGNQIPR